LIAQDWQDKKRAHWSTLYLGQLLSPFLDLRFTALEFTIFINTQRQFTGNDFFRQSLSLSFFSQHITQLHDVLLDVSSSRKDAKAQRNL
jgi:hypothetical protein